MIFRSVSIVFLLTFCLLNACKTEDHRSQDSSETISRVNIDTLHTFTDFETHDIAQPFTILALTNGNVAITDFAQNRVNIVSPGGKLFYTFGREGRGPGEFLRPSKIVETKKINIIDSDQKTISSFDYEGKFLNTYPYKSEGILSEATLIRDSIIVTSAGGINNSLLTLSNLKQDSTFKFGTPRGKNSEVISIESNLNQLKSGQIPDLFKNQTNLRIGENHIYSYLSAYSILQKYDLSGNLIWEKELDFPYNEKIFEQVVERAKQSPGGLPAIVYISDFKVVGTELIFLTRRAGEKDPQLLIKVSENGKINTIASLPMELGYFSEFDIAETAETMYLASSDAGIVYQTTSPF